MTYIPLLSRLFKKPSQISLSSKQYHSNLLLGIFFLLNSIMVKLLFGFNSTIILIQKLVIILSSYVIIDRISILGITGQICSGKSTICDYLKKNYGAIIINIDHINSEVLTQPNVLKEIRKNFGDEVFENGELNKKKVREIIFKDKNKKKILEKITHNKVFLNLFKKIFQYRFVNNNKFIFIENAILLRFFIFKILCKGIIGICVKDNKILIDRIMKRDGINEENAKNILKNQMSSKELEEKCDYIIYNDNMNETEKQIQNMIKYI
jgi:dephospho-CoA kinase